MELYFVVSVVAALVVTVVGSVVVWIVRVILAMVVYDAVRGHPYGLICTYCGHRLDLHRRATRRAYAAGVCPICNHDLFRMEKVC